MAQAIQPWTADLPAQVRAVSQFLFAAANPLSLPVSVASHRAGVELALAD
jgi:hypothetical protein